MFYRSVIGILFCLIIQLSTTVSFYHTTEWYNWVLSFSDWDSTSNYFVWSYNWIIIVLFVSMSFCFDMLAAVSSIVSVDPMPPQITHSNFRKWTYCFTEQVKPCNRVRQDSLPFSRRWQRRVTHSSVAVAGGKVVTGSVWYCKLLVDKLSLVRCDNVGGHVVTGSVWYCKLLVVKLSLVRCDNVGGHVVTGSVWYCKLLVVKLSLVRCDNVGGQVVTGSVWYCRMLVLQLSLVWCDTANC